MDATSKVGIGRKDLLDRVQSLAQSLWYDHSHRATTLPSFQRSKKVPPSRPYSVPKHRGIQRVQQLSLLHSISIVTLENMVCDG
jgi:hypothetical protein